MLSTNRHFNLNIRSGALTGKAYYVSNSGDDSNEGTLKKPFKTIERVNALSFKPGESVLFKGGQTFNGTVEVKANGIEVGSYGTTKAIINAGNGQGIVAIVRKDLIIHDLILTGSGRHTNRQAGLYLEGCSNVHTRDLVTTGLNMGALYYECQNMYSKYIYAHNNGAVGIYADSMWDIDAANIPVSQRRSKNLMFDSCLAENNPGDPFNLNNHSGSGILIGNTDQVLIENCVATNNGWDMPRSGNGPVGIWLYQTDKGTIRKSISYENKTSAQGQDGGGFDLDGGCTNCVIEYCLSYGNEGAGFGLFQYWGAGKFENNTIRFCISINDAQKSGGSLYSWNGSPDAAINNIKVHNNIFHSNKPVFISEQERPIIEIELFNNAFIGSGEFTEPNHNFHDNIIQAEAAGLFTGELITNLTDETKLKTLTQFKPTAALLTGTKTTGTDFFGKKFTNKAFAGISKN